MCYLEDLEKQNHNMRILVMINSIKIANVRIDTELIQGFECLMCSTTHVHVYVWVSEKLREADLYCQALQSFLLWIFIARCHSLGSGC